MKTGTVCFFAIRSKQRGGIGLWLAIARNPVVAQGGRAEAHPLDRGRQRVQAPASDGHVHQQQVISHAGR